MILKHSPNGEIYKRGGFTVYKLLLSSRAELKFTRVIESRDRMGRTYLLIKEKQQYLLVGLAPCLLDNMHV